jgi:hypothetical protein
MNNSSDLSPFSSLDLFSTWYRSIHGYASLIVCLLGIALNFFNIIVLTRKHMISSTNSILTALAISDFITMLVYIPTSLKFYCVLEYNQDASKNCNEADTSEFDFFWTAYALFYVNVTVTMHSFSIWLTVLLAFFRYIYICHNKLGKKMCTMKNTNIAIVLTYLFCIFLCTPSFLVSKIQEVPLTNLTNESSVKTQGKKLYRITSSDINSKTNDLIFRITFFIQAFCVKLIPCLLLIILSSLLVHSIHVANENNKRLMALGRKTRESEKSKEHNRTNIMLVLVCFLFFITEFPQGVLAFLSIIFESTNFHSNVYMKLGDVMDIIALINNAVNFILYCLMSHIFRETFKNIFCKSSCSKRLNDRHGSSLRGRKKRSKKNFNDKNENNIVHENENLIKSKLKQNKKHRFLDKILFNKDKKIDNAVTI